MLTKFKHWLKWELAGDELRKLYLLKLQVDELGVWCSDDKKAVAISKWLKDFHDYPWQLRGAYGSIDDFREYLKTLDKIGN